MKLSLVICTHNPRADILRATLSAIRNQWDGAKKGAWELLLIDNASPTALASIVDLSWTQGTGRLVREERLGLTHARLRAFRESVGDVILFVDDDNILAPGYLTQTQSLMAAHPECGAIGGRVMPAYECEPPPWFEATGISLACRDLGDLPLHANWPDPTAQDRSYPDCAPIGAGMIVRRSAFAAYVEGASGDPRRVALGRRGADLASGEDNDMILTMLGAGWHVAYRPELKLDHVIPAGRLKLSYLQRYARSSNRTWVQVLAVHGISPWPPLSPWTLPLRAIRASIQERPWRSPEAAIRFQSRLGAFEGRASLGALKHVA